MLLRGTQWTDWEGDGFSVRRCCSVELHAFLACSSQKVRFVATSRWKMVRRLSNLMIYRRRCLGDGAVGDDWKIWNRCIVCCFLRFRWGIIAHGAQIPGNGHCLLHRGYRSSHLPLHRPFGRVLQGTASHCYGIFERRWCSNFRFFTGNTQHTFATDDRRGRAVWCWFQTLVVSDETHVSFSIFF